LLGLERPLTRFVYDRFANALFAWNKRKGHCQFRFRNLVRWLSAPLHVAALALALSAPICIRCVNILRGS
jgi:hypothetical protein